MVILVDREKYASTILAIVTLTLLVWPDTASSLTMGLLLSDALGALGMLPKRSQRFKNQIYLHIKS